MRLVIDTNVLLSGLLWYGPPHRLIELARRGEVVLVSSAPLLAELADVLAREKFATILTRVGHTAQSVLDDVKRMVEIVTPLPLAVPVSRDRDDDMVLATASTAQASLIVSGDDDLLSLQFFERIPIVNPAQALAVIESSSSR